MTAAKPHTDLGLVWPSQSKPGTQLPTTRTQHIAEQQRTVASTRSQTQDEVPGLTPPLLLPNIPMTAILLAALFLPPLFFMLVDPHVDAANQKQREVARELIKNRVL
jgi:hypothetical protein